MLPQTLLTEIESRYGVLPEYLWRKYPDYAVFRHAENRKWFAVLLNPPGVRLGLAQTEAVWVLNVKALPENLVILRGMDGVLPAYHMNKSHWASLQLALLPTATILELLDDSFQLTRKRFSQPRNFHDDLA